MDQPGGDLAQRLQHEGPLVQARVRHAEAGLVDPLPAEEEQIEVEAARGVAHRSAPAAGRGLDRQQAIEEHPGPERGHELRGAVQIRALRRRAHRLGLVERRDGRHPDTGARAQRRQRRLELRLAIAEVRAQGDVCGRRRRHGP